MVAIAGAIIKQRTGTFDPSRYLAPGNEVQWPVRRLDDEG